MSQSWDGQPLVDEARRLFEAGDVGAAADLMERAGRSALAGGRHTDGASTLIGACRLHAIQGDLGRATGLLDLAEPAAATCGRLGDVWRARAELADLARDRDAADGAWRKAVKSGDENTRLEGLARLAELAAGRRDFARAVERYGHAIAAGARAEGGRRVPGLLVNRAGCLIDLGNLEKAEQDLARAEALLDAEPGSPRGRLLGQRALLANRREQPETALGFAQAARIAALEEVDGATCFSASLVIAMLHLDAGRDVEAYDTLLEARDALGDLLGPVGADLIEGPLTALATRLGPRVRDVMAQWKALRRSREGGGEPWE